MTILGQGRRATRPQPFRRLRSAGAGYGAAGGKGQNQPTAIASMSVVRFSMARRRARKTRTPVGNFTLVTRLEMVLNALEADTRKMTRKPPKIPWRKSNWKVYKSGLSKSSPAVNGKGF